jgi:predicted metal-dependent peptidase
MQLTSKQRKGFDEAIANMYSNLKYANSYLFYAHLIGQCQIVFDSSLQAPAGVNFMHDHYVLYINPEGSKSVPGFNSFPLEHRLGILKHEMLHILSRHVQRKEDRNHEKFNIATDCAINQLIERQHLPNGAIYPDTFPSPDTPKNLTAEQYYELLPSNNNNSHGSGNSGNGYEQTLDDHSKWEESQGDAELQDDVTKNMLEKAASHTQKSRGTVPSQFSEWLKLVTHKREISWQQLLRNITGNKRVGIRKTLIRRDRRLPNFEWIKGKTKDRKFNLLVISDVSGSVSDKALLSLWGEVRHICDVTSSDIDLIQVDTKPSEPEKLSKRTTVIERKACGGTILYPAVEMAKQKRIDYQALVITTDGWLDPADVQQFAKLNKKVIWLVEANGELMPEMTQKGMQAFQLKE